MTTYICKSPVGCQLQGLARSKTKMFPRLMILQAFLLGALSLTLNPPVPWCIYKSLDCMEFENVIVEKDASIAVLTLNRPQQLNALSYDLVKDLSLVMQEVGRGEEVRVLIVTGREKVFAAGSG